MIDNDRKKNDRGHDRCLKRGGEHISTYHQIFPSIPIYPQLLKIHCPSFSYLLFTCYPESLVSQPTLLISQKETKISYLQSERRSLNIVKEKLWFCKYKLVFNIIPWNAGIRHGPKKARRYESAFPLSSLNTQVKISQKHWRCLCNVVYVTLLRNCFGDERSLQGELLKSHSQNHTYDNSKEVLV